MINLHWARVSNQARRFHARKIVFDRHWEYPRHRHTDYVEWTYIASGCMEQQCEGKTESTSAGQLCVFREGSHHGLKTDGVIFYNINFPVDEYGKLLHFLGDALHSRNLLPEAGTYRIFEVPEGSRQMIAQLGTTLVGANGGSRRDVTFQRALLQIVDEILLPLDESAYESLPPGAFKRLLHKVEHEFSPQIRVADLAAIASWSPSKVSKEFRRHLAITPSAYLNKLRVRHAAALLRNTNGDITSVAYDAGFENLSYFFRLFRDEYQETPRAYRQRFPLVTTV